MSKENNQNTPKKPRFSSWWVYGVIIALILGFQFFSGSTFSTTKKTTTSELQEYLRNGDIAKIVIIRNAGHAKAVLCYPRSERLPDLTDAHDIKDFYL